VRYEKLISLNICASQAKHANEPWPERRSTPFTIRCGAAVLLLLLPSSSSPSLPTAPPHMCSWAAHVDRAGEDGNGSGYGGMLSGARLEIANLRVFILMPFYFDFNARPKCVRRFLIFCSVTDQHCRCLALSAKLANVAAKYLCISTQALSSCHPHSSATPKRVLVEEDPYSVTISERESGKPNEICRPLPRLVANRRYIFGTWLSLFIVGMLPDILAEKRYAAIKTTVLHS